MCRSPCDDVDVTNDDVDATIDDDDVTVRKKTLDLVIILLGYWKSVDVFEG